MILNKLLFLSVILLVLFVCYIWLRYNIASYAQKETFPNEQISAIREQLMLVIEQVIREKTFQNNFMIQNKYGTSLNGYYQLVLCHPLFAECFLDISLKEILLTFKQHGEVESIKTLDELLSNYIRNETKVIDDILTKCLPADFKIQSKQDVILMLKEYAKLLTNSGPKLDLVTSEAFFKDFFINIETTLRVTTEDYLKNNIELIKNTYHYVIIHTRADDLLYQIFLFLRNSLMIAAFTKIFLYYLGAYELSVLLDLPILNVLGENLGKLLFGKGNITDFFELYKQCINLKIYLGEFGYVLPLHLLGSEHRDELTRILIKEMGLSQSVKKYLEYVDYQKWLWSVD